MNTRITFHIGYRKAASTWLQDSVFSQHPQVRCFVTERLFSRDPFLSEILMTPDLVFDPLVARRRFDERVAELDVGPDDVVLVSAEWLSGHGATGGYESVRTAQRLAAVVPEARIFSVVREQVGMLESEYRQLVREGTPAPIKAFLHGPPRLAIRVGFDTGRYEYDLLADKYVELFGEDKVRLFGFGAISRDRRGFLDDLAAFLGIDPWPEIADVALSRQVNTNLPRRLMGVRRFMNHFERSGLNPYPLIALKPRWRPPLAFLSSRLPPPKAPFFDDATQRWIRERYAASNQRLAERYGVDLR